MPPILHVKNLSKEYRISAHPLPYLTLRETISSMVRRPFAGRRRGDRDGQQSVWALRDVSFEVMPGEIVGVIGRNGAGKSTLLKILSRITQPTAGTVDLYGRVGSLLEVGTGFHSELSGRENIYLNGAILGMKRQEISGKFDEIVAFAEVERFLDVPVKRYSSGMYMRLAFAVAAHLEPEVLLVDEVLAVGDAAFQRKCLGKMGSVARSGRTVMFVSHNMSAVQSLCSRAMLLTDGRVSYSGSTQSCIERYLSEVSREESSEVDLTAVQRPAAVDTDLRILRIRLETESGRPLVRAGDPVELELLFRVAEAVDEVSLGVAVQSAGNVAVLECRSSHCYGPIPRLEPGDYRVRCVIEGNPLNPGLYFLSAGARCSSKYLDFVPNAMTFEVYAERAPASLWLDETGGLVHVPSRWTIPEYIAEAGRSG